MQQGTIDHVQEGLGTAAQGGIPDFAEIVRAHQGMIFSLAYHFLRDRGLAEEMAQEVFLELHRHLGSIESSSHLVFWLRKVASRKCIDQNRRRSFWPKFRLDEIPEPAAKTRETDTLLSGALGRLVASLPEKPRMVVVLRYQEDLDTAAQRVLNSLTIHAIWYAQDIDVRGLVDPLPESVAESGGGAIG